jgi:hypothetical protein
MLALAACLLANLEVMACEVCKKQQPKILRGVTHGAGPQSDWDYVIVGCVIILVLISLFYTIKWILHPGEKESEHIKRSILN